MSEMTLFYATNRKHQGSRRFEPKGYGADFSQDGLENLRFGRLSLGVDTEKVDALMKKKRAGGAVNGEGLASYLSGLAGNAKIDAYVESVNPKIAEEQQEGKTLGSAAFFSDLREVMKGGTDVVVFVHGFNVTWKEAVGNALALQLTLNRTDGSDPKQKTNVVLFSWPSDGLALPYMSYKSDRSEAKCSGYAVGRAFLRLRDFLISLRRNNAALCDQQIHLLCHSMGNYVLENAVQRLAEFTPGSALPRMFEHIFMCAPDVDDDVLQPGKPLGRVHELARKVTIYHNRDDKAMYISDYSKGNPERLGTNGPAQANAIHQKCEAVDTTLVTKEKGGMVKHSYFLSGSTNLDIRHSLEGVDSNDGRRNRATSRIGQNYYVMQPIDSR